MSQEFEKVSILKDVNVTYSLQSGAALGSDPVSPAGDVEVQDEVIDELKMMADMCDDNDDPEGCAMYMRWISRIRRGDASVTRLTAENARLQGELKAHGDLFNTKRRVNRKLRAELTKALEYIKSLRGVAHTKGGITLDADIDDFLAHQSAPAAKGDGDE